MQIADWAFVVSLVSAAISLFSLGWNVWSKWIHPKPRIKVGFAVMTLIYDTHQSPPFLSVYATNFGPSETSLKQLIARHRAPGWWYKVGSGRRWVWGIMNHMRAPEQAIAEEYDRFGSLPVKLAVGEEFKTYLIFKHQHLRDDRIIDVGFVDVFGRHHWAPRKSVKAVVKRIQADWPKETK